MMRRYEKTGEFLLLEFDQLQYKFHRRVEKYKKGKTMSAFQTVIETSWRTGRLTLKLQFRYDNEDEKMTRMEGFARIIGSILKQS